MFTNVASVSTDNDPNDENNSAPATTFVPESSADLGVTKSVNNTQAVANTDVTFTIAVENNGPDTAMSATLNDTLPGDMTFVALAQISGTAWSCSSPAVGDGGTITCTTESLADGAQATFQITGHIPSGAATATTYENTATVGSNTADNNPENDSSIASTTVVAAAPSLSTTASATVPIGGSISDTANLTGGASATGTITFRAYGPNDATCGGNADFFSTVDVHGDGTYNSGSFTPGTAGTYRFIATYSGDANNVSTTSQCSDVHESVIVTKKTPALSTNASPGVTLGNGSISDQATLAGGATPSGSITFKLFGPSNGGCSGAPTFTSTVTVSGNGNYSSGPFSPPQTGTYSWVASYSGDPNNNTLSGSCGDPNESVTVAQATPTPTATVTPSPTVTPTPTPQPTPSDVLNLSTRERVLTGDDVAIGGFIITGSAPKKVILRGIGPSLKDKGVADYLPDPFLELHGSNGSVIASNDNWKDDPSQAAQLQASGIAPTDDLESAIEISLSPGAYTAIVKGKGGVTGIALVDIYDVDTAAFSALANLSTRGFVGNGDNVMIGGFTLGRTSGAAHVVLRAIGPSLTQRGISNALPDPTLELHNSNGDKIAFDDNWQDDPAQSAEIQSDGLAPADPAESALDATLAAGPYTVIVGGKDGASGVALVEIYRLP
jgi:uncharacterized repeat protein (TIGR01451 family)